MECGSLLPLWRAEACFRACPSAERATHLGHRPARLGSQQQAAAGEKRRQAAALHGRHSEITPTGAFPDKLDQADQVLLGGVRVHERAPQVEGLADAGLHQEKLA